MNNVKKSIGWADFTINPVKGLCPVDCKDLQGKSYCYARRMYKRFKWDETIRYEPKAMQLAYDLQVRHDLIPKLKPIGPQRVFIGSTMELFGPWVKHEWMQEILHDCRECPSHTFIFLTKRPQELARYEWPGNAWVGATVTDNETCREALHYLYDVEARVKFISLEPYLAPLQLMGDYICSGLPCEWNRIDWLIVGRKTPGKPAFPTVEDLRRIENHANREGIPLFEKNNLKPLLGDNLRQEWPR
jgi:protein gp37